MKVVLGDDCISRQAVIDMTGLSEWFDSSDSYNEFVIALSNLPSVIPQFSSRLEKDFGESGRMTKEAIEYFKFNRKIFCEDHLKICPKDSIAYQATLKEKEFYDMAIKALEQEPRKGHWIKGYTFPDGTYWKCDKCNELIKVKFPMHYCNNCGADMREVEE